MWMTCTPSPVQLSCGLRMKLICRGPGQVADVEDVDAALLAAGLVERAQVGVVAEHGDVGDPALRAG